MSLTDFLLARIEEDDTDAYDHYSIHEDGSDVAGAPCVIDGGAHPCRTRRRIIAECEAKRRIVSMATEWLSAEVGEAGDWLLCLLALPYADHPDYRQEWKP